MDSIGGAPGYVCSEAAVGTNSIGLALVTRRAATVRGFEHYADGLTGFAGISRAITHPLTAQLVGAVTLVCPDHEYSPVMRALVGRVASEIRHRLSLGAPPGSTTLQDRFLAAGRRTTGPLAVLDARTLLGNSAAAALLGPNPDLAALWACMQRTFAGEHVWMGPGAREARCEPIYDGSSLVGAVVRWDTNPSIHEPVSAGGAHDSSGRTDLTAAERSVAEHVSRGLTNRETATVLYVSPAHSGCSTCGRCCRKLGVHSRVELARKFATTEH